MMKITLLGTGTSQGVPVIGCSCEVCRSGDPRDHRLRTSAFVEWDGCKLLIDTGPDLRQQLLREGIAAVDAVLLTHEHKDHLAGLDDIRPIYFRQKQPMDLFAMQRVLAVVRKDFDYAFRTNPYPGAPAFNLHPIRYNAFRVKDVEIQPIQVRHLALPILGYRIGPFAYITDASYVADAEIALLSDLDVLVVNALHREKHYSHFNLEQALQFVERVRPNRAFLTHTSHHMGLYADVEKILPPQVTLGYDGLQIVIDK